MNIKKLLYLNYGDSHIDYVYRLCYDGPGTGGACDIVSGVGVPCILFYILH